MSTESPVTSFDAAIRDFEDHLTLNFRSLNTISAYGLDLRQFGEFCQARSILEVGDVTEGHVQEFLANLGKRTATVARKLCAIRSFYDFLMKQNVALTDPTVNVNVKRDPNVKRRVLSQRQVRLIVEGAPMGTRDRAILELLALGLRPTEVIELKVGNIDNNRSTVSVGKREVELDEACIQALEAYMVTGYRMAHKSTPGLLFFNYQGRSMSRATVWQIVQAHAVGGHVSPADLRRSRTVHLIRSGIDEQVVKNQLGHADVSTTQQYRKFA